MQQIYFNNENIHLFFLSPYNRYYATDEYILVFSLLSYKKIKMKSHYADVLFPFLEKGIRYTDLKNILATTIKEDNPDSLIKLLYELKFIE